MSIAELVQLELSVATLVAVLLFQSAFHLHTDRLSKRQVNCIGLGVPELQFESLDLDWSSGESVRES
ncbi:hypothetical protein MFFC18_47820 [Mariniblastus fucicola]|uniref:Uncharacterized protein n=1 Tax=Mariniblastus fucicola TaxID=980251 RepID=A0A5B9PGY3_9BACT|nr:hypothetical protein MFFC18_47820 [Mariniblastus fucicola]